MKKYLIFLLLPFYLIAGEPIAIWLTWQQDPTTTMTIQWLTHADDAADHVWYHQKGVDGIQILQGNHASLPDQNIVHRVELTKLLPQTTYEFSLGNTNSKWYFRTMPTNNHSTVRFVVGGDMYHGSLRDLHKTNKQAAKTNPQFVVIGGDIAYSCSRFSFYKENGDRWMDWLKAWYQDMVTTDNCLIPIVAVIGNHEVTGSFDQTPNQAKYFYTLFPMPNRQAYRCLDFSDYLTLILLDSGHTASIEGAQSEWLIRTLAEKKNFPHKFAVYHVPAYPSIRSEKYKYSEIIRKNWVPIFDEYHLDIAFEHHDHAYKRTYKLRHNQKDSNGTLYLGDGAWSPSSARTNSNHAWYIKKSAAKKHFLAVYLKDKERTIFAMSDQGKIIDSVKE